MIALLRANLKYIGGIVPTFFVKMTSENIYGKQQNV